jgi:hypothetical protein
MFGAWMNVKVWIWIESLGIRSRLMWREVVAQHGGKCNDAWVSSGEYSRGGNESGTGRCWTLMCTVLRVRCECGILYFVFVVHVHAVQLMGMVDMLADQKFRNWRWNFINVRWSGRSGWVSWVEETRGSEVWWDGMKKIQSLCLAVAKMKRDEVYGPMTTWQIWVTMWTRSL